MRPELSSLVLPQDEGRGVPGNCNPGVLATTYARVPPWFGMLPPPYDGRMIPDNATLTERRQFALLRPLLKDLVSSACSYMFSYTLYDTLFGEERVKQIIAAKRLLEDQKLTLYDLWRNYRRRRTWVPLIEHPYLIDFVQEVFDVLKGTRYYRYHGKLENKIDLIVRPWEETNFFRFYTSIPASVGRLPPPYDLCSYRVSEEDSVAADLMTRSIAQSSVELLSPLPYLNTFSESNIGPLHQKERVHVILVLKMMLEYGIIELDYFEYIVDLAYDLRELIGLLSDIGIGVSYDFISLADDLLDRLYDSRGTLTEAPKYTDQQSIVRLNELDTI